MKNLFSKPKENPVESVMDVVEENWDLSKLNRQADDVQKKIEKALDLFQFQIQPEMMGGEGGHFGQEFELRATVGRLKSLYIKEPWCFATAALIAKKLITVPFRVQDPLTEEFIDNHPLEKVLNAGNSMQDSKSMDWAGYVDLVMGGNYFRVMDERYQVPYHLPVEYVGLDMRDLKTLEDKKKFQEVGPIESLQIQQNFMHGFGLYESKIPYEQVIHHKFPNPFNPFYGLSLYTAASRPILLDRHKNEFEMAFYLRGATNAGVIETTEDMTKTRMERLMKTFEQAFTGKRNWWRTLFLPKGAKWVNSGLTMNEMQHLEGLRENRLTLLAVLGIPPSQVGIVQDVNRSTSETEERALWSNTIQPIADFIAAGWNNSYLVRVIYGGKVQVVPDYTGITAVEGSLASKQPDIQAVEKVATVNEIREKVLGWVKLKETDPRGNMFPIEIGPTFSNPFGEPADEGKPGDLGPDDPEPDKVPDDGDPEDKAKERERVKSTISENQERIEKKQGSVFMKVFDSYVKLLVSQAKKALIGGNDIRAHLEAQRNVRAELYSKSGIPVLIDTQEKGFILGNTSAKSFTLLVSKKQFAEIDEIAIEIIRDKTRDNKRTLLAERSLTHFLGFDEHKTEQIMRIIENGLEAGKTTEQIAKNMEKDFVERYGDQFFTISRTEILHAVSQGLQWNQETLGTVFSEVHKQWFHVGDVSSNPDAREGHAAFEDAGKNGVVPADHVWVNENTGGRLRYPRDFQAGAEDVINCRCSMANVIPSGAVSNAEAIIATE